MKTHNFFKPRANVIFLAFTLLLTATIACSQKSKEETLDPEILAEVDREGILKTMFRHRRHVSQCYGQILTEKGQETLKGKLTMKMSIGLDGKAQNVEFVPEDSTIENTQLNDCITQGLVTWDFPVHPKGEVITFKYPWVFSDAPPSHMQEKLDKFENLKKTE